MLHKMRASLGGAPVDMPEGQVFGAAQAAILWSQHRDDVEPHRG